MRILQICNKAPYPANDGSSIAICNLAEGLADNGIELYLLPINTKKHFKADDAIPDSFKQKTHYRSVYKNTNTHALGALLNLGSSQSYFVSRFFFKSYKTVLIDVLKQQSFDIIQLEGVFMASYIPVIKAYSKAKIVIRTHNVEHQIWGRHLANEKTGLKKWYLSLQNKRLKHFELQAFQQADALVTITQEDQKIIESLAPGKPVHTCLTGINLSTYQEITHPKQPNTLFHFASMDWLPNKEAVDWLLEQVWKTVLKELPDARLILAGRGMPEHIRQQASQNLEVMDEITHSEEFYKTYDVMLVPLWSGSGLRIKLVEGLAYGKPIITTSIGAEGIPYMANQDLIIADTAADFSKAIISLLSEPSKKQSLQHSARRLAEHHFNYKTLAADLVRFYDQLRSL